MDKIQPIKKYISLIDNFEAFKYNIGKNITYKIIKYKNAQMQEYHFDDYKLNFIYQHFTKTQEYETEDELNSIIEKLEDKQWFMIYELHYFYTPKNMPLHAKVNCKSNLDYLKFSEDNCVEICLMNAYYKTSTFMDGYKYDWYNPFDDLSNSKDVIIEEV